MNFGLVIELMEKEWLDQLTKKLPVLYPDLPKPEFWEKDGCTRLYFNHESSDGFEVGFYIDFTEEEPKIWQFKEEYWLDKLSHTSFQQFESAVKAEWNNIAREQIAKNTEDVDMEKVEVHEDPLLEKRCFQCKQLFKTYKSERATYCDTCKMQL
jgi:hypothetical protein